MTRRRRVAIVCFNEIDVDTRVRREAESLARHGYEVCYFYPDHVGKEIQGQREPHLFYQAVSFPVRTSGPRLRQLARRWAVEDDLLTVDPKVFESARGWASRLDEFLASSTPMAAYRKLRLALKPVYYSSAALKAGARRMRGQPKPHALHVEPALDPDIQRALLRWKLSIVLHLAQAAIRFRPDVTLAIDAPMLLAGAGLRHRCGARLVYDAHEIYYAQEPPQSRSRVWTDFWFMFERLFLQYTDARTAVSKSIANYLQSDHASGPVTVTYNAPRYLPPQHTREGPNEPFVAEYHGGLLPKRGIEELVSAGQWLNRAQLRIRGRGELEPKLRQQIATMGLGQRVFLDGNIPYDKLVEKLSQDDLCVLCYPAHCRNNEVSLPNKFYEAMMAGLPLLVPQRDELAALVRQHGLGVVVDEETPKAMAHHIEGFAAQGSKAWLECHKRCLLAARDVFRWEREEPKFLDCFEEDQDAAKIANPAADKAVV